MIGVDEHVWRHTRPRDQGESYVTVIKTATVEELPDAVAVMDPFYVAPAGGSSW